MGFLDVQCTALGAGLYAPGRAVGCTIIGSTGMHMRLFDSADLVELAPEPTGYTMPFPVPGAVAQMQSNMAATLNIDWVVDLVREGVGLLDGREVSRREALLALDARVLDARPGAALYHPYISRRRRARPLRRRQRPRPALRPDQRRALARPGPLRLSRAWPSPPATATPPSATGRTRSGSPAAPPARRRCARSWRARSAPRSASPRARRRARPAR